MAAGRLAKLAGARRVIGTIGRPGDVDGALAAGYDAVLVRDGSLEEAIRSAAGGRGVDAILDPQGTALLELDVAVAATGGRLVIFGNASGGPLDPVPAAHLFAKNLTVAGFSLTRLAAEAPERVAGALGGVLADLGSGRLPADISVVEELEAVSEVHQALSEGRAPAKSVVRVTVRPGSASAPSAPSRQTPAATRQPA